MKTIIDTIGQTPLVYLPEFSTERVCIFAKLEGQNPSGSIKDRIALHMIEQAEIRGDLKKGMTILEATSGNMGIALSFVGRQKGYAVKILMSEAMSDERKMIMRSFGAELVLTDKNLGTAGAIQKSREILAENTEKYWFSDQFNNLDNADAHYHGLAPELLQNLEKIDYLVAGMGTGGTISGIARKFREISPKTKIIGVVPPAGYKVQGIQNPKQDFAGKVLQTDLIHDFISVEVEESYQAAKKLAENGIFAGMSSGSMLTGALKLKEKITEGNIVIIIPDRGEKYLSTPLFK